LRKVEVHGIEFYYQMLTESPCAVYQSRHRHYCAAEKNRVVGLFGEKQTVGAKNQGLVPNFDSIGAYQVDVVASYRATNCIRDLAEENYVSIAGFGNYHRDSTICVLVKNQGSCSVDATELSTVDGSLNWRLSKKSSQGAVEVLMHFAVVVRALATVASADRVGTGGQPGLVEVGPTGVANWAFAGPDLGFAEDAQLLFSTAT
jgi:hypothetical protein